MSTMPTRIDGDLFEAAKAAGQVHSRSAAQQLGHWARLGRELEASPAVTHRMVEQVLTGTLPYDEADDRAQALVRVAWDQQIAEDIAASDFTDELNASGKPWAEADEAGNLIVHTPPEPRT